MSIQDTEIESLKTKIDELEIAFDSCNRARQTAEAECEKLKGTIADLVAAGKDLITVWDTDGGQAEEKLLDTIAKAESISRD